MWHTKKDYIIQVSVVLGPFTVTLVLLTVVFFALVSGDVFKSGDEVLLSIIVRPKDQVFIILFPQRAWFASAGWHLPRLYEPQ